MDHKGFGGLYLHRELFYVKVSETESILKPTEYKINSDFPKKKKKFELKRK